MAYIINALIFSKQKNDIHVSFIKVRREPVLWCPVTGGSGVWKRECVRVCVFVRKMHLQDVIPTREYVLVKAQYNQVWETHAKEAQETITNYIKQFIICFN